MSSPSALFLLLVRPRSLELFSISALSSVVEDGSPGSSWLIEGALTAPFESAALERVRARFGGGAAPSMEGGCFLCLVFEAGESASSSPEASRDEGWRRSVVDDFRRSLEIWEMRLRFVEAFEEDGEDILAAGGYELKAPCCIRGCRYTVG